MDGHRSRDLSAEQAEAVHTNGRGYLLLAGTTDVEYHAHRVTDLVDSPSAIEPYSRDAWNLRLERLETDGQLDAGDGNAGPSGVHGETDFEGRNDRPGDDAMEGASTECGVTERESTEGETAGHGAREGNGETGGEYVIRFFTDRGPIGVIGHLPSCGTLVEAAEYLLRRGLAGVDVPWSPDDGDGSVLNAEPPTPTERRWPNRSASRMDSPSILTATTEPDASKH